MSRWIAVNTTTQECLAIDADRWYDAREAARIGYAAATYDAIIVQEDVAGDFAPDLVVTYTGNASSGTLQRLIYPLGMPSTKKKRR